VRDEFVYCVLDDRSSRLEVSGSGSDRAKWLIDELALLGAPKTQGDQVKVFQILRDLEALGGTHVAEHFVSTRDLGLKILLGDFLSFTRGAGAHRAFTEIFRDDHEPEQSRARAA
jgi:hypothetical protein